MKNSIILFNSLDEKSSKTEIILNPAIIYSNVKTDKTAILSDNRGKAGIYLFYHKESGKIYIGSAYDLSKRLTKYYSPLELERMNNYISRAIIHHTHSAFSLSILEYIEISTLDKKQARKLILCREQHYIDSLSPKYNILSIAGSRLGCLHSEKTKAKMSEAHQGKNHYDKTKAKISETMIGITRSTETKAKISLALSKRVFVYSNTTLIILEYEFVSYSEATKHFNCSIMTISRYINSGKLLQKQWILCSSKSE